MINTDTNSDSLNIFYKLANQKRGGSPQNIDILSTTSDFNYSNNHLQNIPTFINKHKFIILIIVILITIFIYRKEIKNVCNRIVGKSDNDQKESQSNDQKESQSNYKRKSSSNDSSRLLSSYLYPF